MKTQDESEKDCAACGEFFPREELAEHGGFCERCHEQAVADAFGLYEWTDGRHDVEELTELILAYWNMKACADVMGMHLLDRAIKSGAPFSPRLHDPS